MMPLYVFALTNKPGPALHYGRRRIQFVEIDGVHAAVERVARRPPVSEAALRSQHEIVTRLAESVDAILPARFGAFVEPAELEALVALRRERIVRTLALVSGRIQMTVRTFRPDSPGESRNAQPVSTKPMSGTEYLVQRRGAVPRLGGAAACISTALAPLVREERRYPGEGRVEWTLYHLVDRTTLPRYESEIAAFTSPAVAVTGPWPPFAFAPDLWE
jgi:hypothetical protein